MKPEEREALRLLCKVIRRLDREMCGREQGFIYPEERIQIDEYANDSRPAIAQPEAPKAAPENPVLIPGDDAQCPTHPGQLVAECIYCAAQSWRDRYEALDRQVRRERTLMEKLEALMLRIQPEAPKPAVTEEELAREMRTALDEWSGYSGWSVQSAICARVALRLLREGGK